MFPLKGGEFMYLCVKQQLKHLSKMDYTTLCELCHAAKNLYNVGLYNVRQHYFNTGKYLRYEENNKLSKANENYKLLNSNMSQQILKEVDGAFRSFFGLIRKAQNKNYDPRAVKLPKYLEKESFFTLVIGFVRISNNELLIPYSSSYRKDHKSINIKRPPALHDKTINEIRIVPKHNARFFEVQYTYEVAEIQRELDYTKALAVDLGLDNLATCVTNEGRSFIVDGKKLKSYNQLFNKENTKLQSIKDKQGITKTTRKQALILRKRNNRINDYINKACRHIINYCITSKTGNLVVGYNDSLQKDINFGKVNNQNFVNLPIGKITDKLEYLCQLNGIRFVRQEESYTSKASFFDGDDIPVFDKNVSKEYSFSGKRIKRGLYKTKTGYLLNADVNGALNILKKSNVVCLEALYSRGAVDAPVRKQVC